MKSYSGKRNTDPKVSEQNRRTAYETLCSNDRSTACKLPQVILTSWVDEETTESATTGECLFDLFR